jgi:hypothetical protein
MMLLNDWLSSFKKFEDPPDKCVYDYLKNH